MTLLYLKLCNRIIAAVLQKKVRIVAAVVMTTKDCSTEGNCHGSYFLSEAIFSQALMSNVSNYLQRTGLGVKPSPSSKTLFIIPLDWRLRGAIQPIEPYWLVSKRIADHIL